MQHHVCYTKEHGAVHHRHVFIGQASDFHSEREQSEFDSMWKIKWLREIYRTREVPLFTKIHASRLKRDLIVEQYHTAIS